MHGSSHERRALGAGQKEGHKGQGSRAKSIGDKSLGVVDIRLEEFSGRER